MGFPGGASGKELTCQCRRHKRRGFKPWVGKIPQRRAWQPTPVFLPRKSRGQSSLAGFCDHGIAKSRTQLKRLSTHAHIRPQTAVAVMACCKSLVRFTGISISYKRPPPGLGSPFQLPVDQYSEKTSLPPEGSQDPWEKVWQGACCPLLLAHLPSYWILFV